ncbi:MAG TPA: hypothetical protein VNC22_08380 [Sporichthya sp.]|jgi:hypothetical protein|nr:hypothetical protein [Sporichthya sp.]
MLRLPARSEVARFRAFTVVWDTPLGAPLVIAAGTFDQVGNAYSLAFCLPEFIPELPDRIGMFCDPARRHRLVLADYCPSAQWHESGGLDECCLVAGHVGPHIDYRVYRRWDDGAEGVVSA